MVFYENNRMKRIRPLFTLLLLWLCFMGLVLPAAAQEDDETATDSPGISLEVEAGLDSYYKGEDWVPVQVTVANSGPSFEGTLLIRFGATQEEQTYTAPVSLPTQSNKRVTLYVAMTTYTSRLTVQLLDEAGDQVARTTSSPLSRMEATDLLYAVISPNGAELGFLEDVSGGRTDAKVALLELDDLPAAAAGWDMLDVLIIHDTDVSQMTAEQQEALDGWLSLGGQLVVAGGAGWQKTAAALTDYLPVTITGSESVADLPGLRTQIGSPFRDDGPYLVTTSTLSNGELLYHEDGLPLLARREWGRGRVYFLALDPTLAPLADWDGSPLLWQTIAGVAPRLPFWANGFSNTYAASEAVKNIPTLALPSAILLLCFMGVYVVLIGPVNYLVLKRLKRREWAWITIPATILVFTACAYVTGFGLKGNNLILHQMNVAYGQANSPALRVNSLVALYSPRRATYDFILPGDVMALPFTQGFGPGFVGTGNVNAIERGTNLILRDVRIDVSDSQTFMVESYRLAPEINSDVRLILQNGKFELNITVRNDSQITLENAVLLYGSTMHSLNDLEPGEEVSWNRALSATEAAATGSTVYSSYGGYTSPLLNNDLQLLGTNSPYDEPVAYSRRQLLEAMHQDLYYGGSGSYLIPRGVVTLIGWSEDQLLEMTVDSRRGQEQVASTLYFLELPMTQTQVSGRDIIIPKTMLSWDILANNGQYGGLGIEDITLYNGSVEYEFQPIPELATISVNTLQLILTRQSYSTSSLPSVSVWNWTSDEWNDIPLADFRGRRYKCLICYDYDRAASYGDGSVFKERHTTDHPMQCCLWSA